MQKSGELWIKSNEKRHRDIKRARALLVPAAPLILLSTVALYLEKPTVNPWFSQPRVGQDGELFNIHKLRTMTSTKFYDAGSGPKDNRRTAVGKKIARLGFDELPQLLNILHDDMSMVGPRPLPTVVVDNMKDVLSPSEFSDWYRAYTLPKPGFVSEFSNLSRSLNPDSDEFLLMRAKLDTTYLDKASDEFDTQVIREASAHVVGRLTTLFTGTT